MLLECFEFLLETLNFVSVAGVKCSQRARSCRPARACLLFISRRVLLAIREGRCYLLRDRGVFMQRTVPCAAADPAGGSPRGTPNAMGPLLHPQPAAADPAARSSPAASELCPEPPSPLPLAQWPVRFCLPSRPSAGEIRACKELRTLRGDLFCTPHHHRHHLQASTSR